MTRGRAGGRRLRRGALAAALATSLAAAGGPGGAGAARAQAIDLSHGGPVSVTARDGIDWNQGAQIVVARGDARAIRGDVTVTADELVAHYRKKAVPAGTPARPPKPLAPVQMDTSAPGGAAPDAAASGTGASGSGAVDAAGAVADAAAAPKPGGATPGIGDDTGANEIFRLEALGHVHIFTATDQAWGDHATYDIDQAVLVLTGSGLKLVTPQDVLTARDAMEYWSARHMAVGRGDAVVTTNDQRRVQADVLVGYTVDPNAPVPAAGPGAHPVKAGTDKEGAGKAGTDKAGAGKQGADPLATSGKLQRVDGFGHVRVQTPTEIVTGDKGVYVPDTGIARIVGVVHITRGENVLNGAAAIVNMHTGLATLSQNPGTRVEGLIVPNSAPPAGGPGASAGTPKAAGGKAARPPRAGAAPEAGAAGAPGPSAAATAAGATLAGGVR